MDLLCFFGHHRSASSWTKDVLNTVATAVGWRHTFVHDASMFEHDLPGYLKRHRPELITFTNAKQAYLADLPPYRGLHVVRDPRDVLVSSYFSHRYSHPTDHWQALIEHRAQLQACSEEQGLAMVIDCRREQFTDMLTWSYDNPHVQELQMESLTHDPLPHFLRLFECWGRLKESTNQSQERRLVALNRFLIKVERRLNRRLPRLPGARSHHVWPWLIEEVVAANDFYRKSGGRTVGQADKYHHYRSGAPGSWKPYFSQELTQTFKAEYNELLVKLGYERDAQW